MLMYRFGKSAIRKAPVDLGGRELPVPEHGLAARSWGPTFQHQRRHISRPIQIQARELDRILLRASSGRRIWLRSIQVLLHKRSGRKTRIPRQPETARNSVSPETTNRCRPGQGTGEELVIIKIRTDLFRQLFWLCNVGVYCDKSEKRFQLDPFVTIGQRTANALIFI
jgi:hypothetical protein